MKAIIIGPSLSGKTSLIRHLRETTSLNISEMDERLTALNGGIFPSDTNQKHNVLAPLVISSVLDKEDILFFTNTDYFTTDNLITAREKGFKIIQLNLSLEKLIERNEHRVKEEGYDDLSQYLKGMLRYQQEMEEKGLFDIVLDADRPVEVIAKDILDLTVV